MTSAEAPIGRDILKALEASSTCTKSTLSTIEELLLGSPVIKNETASKENDKTTRGRSRANTLASKPKPVPGHRRTKTTVAAVEIKKTPVLNLQEKPAFAFQVVNSCLKTLSQLSKDRINSKRLAKEDPGAKLAPKSKPLPDSALRPKSPNARRFRAIDEVCESRPKTPDVKDPGQIAACATTALTYLRDRYRVAEKKDTAYQVEQGLLSLIEKCVDLEVLGVALEQIEILKGRLEEHLGVKPKKKTIARQDAAFYSTLLTFPSGVEKTGFLTLAIKFQFQVLRLVCLGRDPEAVTGLTDILVDISPSSQVSALFLHQAHQEENRPKALRQLGMLSRMLMEFCIITGSPTTKQRSGTKVSPESVLRLKCAALELQVKSWYISKELKTEDVNELWHRISRCIETYARTTAVLGAERFQFASKALGSLFECFRGQEATLPGLKAAQRCLGEIARDTGLVAEATRLIPTASSVQEIVREASRRLLSDHDYDSLRSAADVLLGDLGSVEKDMDKLLLEVNSLRRSVHKVISEESEVEKDSENLSICLHASQSCVRFLQIYLEDAVEDLDKLCMAKKVAKGFIITTILSCQRNIATEVVDCDKISEALGACCELFSSLTSADNEFATERFSASADPKSSIFVKISNLCYNLWARNQGNSSVSEAALRLLRQSVAILQPWSQEERENGRYTAKLQFLIDTYISHGNWDDAHASSLELLQAHTDSGFLREVAEDAATKPLRGLRTDGAAGRPVFRVVNTLITILLRSNLTHIDGDQQDLRLDERGILMEWQLEALVPHVLRDGKQRGRAVELVNAILQDLFALYTKKAFPVRRLRVATVAARLCSVATEVWETYASAIEVQLGSVISTLGNDKGLKCYIPALQAMLSSVVGLLDYETETSTNKSDQYVATWERVLQVLNTQDDVNTCIEDMDVWVDHIAVLADYYAMRGKTRSEARILELSLQVLELSAIEKAVECIEMQCRLGQVYVEMGYTGKAGMVLAKARSGAESKAATDLVKVKWHVAYAKYLIAIGDQVRCREMLQEGERIASQGLVDMIFAPSRSPKIDEKLLIARAALLASRLELLEGRPGPALRLNTIAKSILFQLWSSLERSMPPDDTSSVDSKMTGTSDEDSSSLTEAAQPVMLTRTYSRLTGPRFWKLVPDLIETAMVEQTIHIFQGKFKEADAAIGRAILVADTVSSESIAICHAAAADLYVRSRPANDLDIRDEKVDQARAELGKVDIDLKSKAAVAFGIVDARILGAEGKREEQVVCLRSSVKLVKELFEYSSLQKAEPPEEVDLLADKLAAVQLTKSRKLPVKTTRSKPSVPKVIAPKKGKVVKVSPATPEEAPVCPSNDCIPLNALHGHILRETAIATLDQPTKKGASSPSDLFEEAGHLQFSSIDIVSHGLTNSRLLAHQASELIAGDISFNGLPDSIISLPAPQQREHSIASLAEIEPKAKTTRKPKTTKKTKAVEQEKLTSVSVPRFATQLQAAHDSLHQNFALSLANSSYALFREQSYLLSDISITISAASYASPIDVVHPLSSAYYNELPNVRARCLDRDAEHPNNEKLSRTDLKRWPSLAEPQIEPEFTGLARSNFFENFIDILPKAWNIVSMSLSDDKSALKLVRYRHGQSPFVLRIPFTHRAAVDADEEVLDAITAFTELREIIRRHTFVARDAGVTNTPEYREKYWAEKRHFDGEVRRLLFKVDNQWFGAFKGMFSHQICDPQALANFQAHLQGVLMQHCPSRKSKGKGKMVPPVLEPRILELFVGLGDPSSEVRVEVEDEDEDEAGFVMSELAETSQMAEGIQDLVRLVLESMQFNGESIAIDEVDLDVVTIAIIDALKVYYTAISKTSQRSCQHTILILDNHLHSFPWESLPSLRYQSVSRLPSLADLRDRILVARLEASEARHQGHTISRRSGTSLMNPSGDLTRTAERFQPWLNKLPENWAHMRHAPNDEGWRAMLSENDLFLYVGHGSTSQYVRPRVVKKLQYQEEKQQTCAVSWLIGCGSAAVEDLGEFEPSGMVLAYLAAGAPAVLGALWDVGDRDADEFSIWTGEWWGLWGNDNSDLGGLDKKMAAKKKVIEKERNGRTVGLCEAVAKGRETCMLGYLNGAAFVVYGIPVFLED